MKLFNSSGKNLTLALLLVMLVANITSWPHLDTRSLAAQYAPSLLRRSAGREMQRPEEESAFLDLDLPLVGNSHSEEEFRLCCECRGCTGIHCTMY